MATPWVAGLVALLVSISSNGLGTAQHAYFNYLADTFLHGHLGLRLIPPSVHDLAYFAGQYYLYWPPSPQCS